MEEIFKTCVEAPNYEISNLGRLRNKKTKHFRTFGNNGKGYMTVQINIDSAKYKVSVQENIKRTIEKFRNEQIQAPYSCLTCIGKDDYGIEQVFNENAFSKTISIILAQNEEKLLNPKSVFEELIRRIEGNA